MKKSLITSAIALALLSSVAQASEVTPAANTEVAAAFEANTTATVAVLSTGDMRATEGAAWIKLPWQAPLLGAGWSRVGQIVKSTGIGSGVYNWINTNVTHRGW